MTLIRVAIAYEYHAADCPECQGQGLCRIGAQLLNCIPLAIAEERITTVACTTKESDVLQCSDCLTICPRSAALCQGCRSTNLKPYSRLQFVAIGDTIMRGSERVGRMRSHTMAKRTANALNKHVPNREGV